MEHHPDSFANGRYVVLLMLGEGGMGFAYLARDAATGRPVAVKSLRPEMMRRKGAMQRFKREIATMAGIDHPNAVMLFDADDGSTGGSPMLVMELVRGVTLAACQRHEGNPRGFGPIPPRTAATIALSILSALAPMHDRGVVHRDIKPANVMIDWKLSREWRRLVVKLMDFGIARVAMDEDDAAARQTGTSASMGSLLYSAPEQLGSARDADVRADIYAVGATLYTVLTGRYPGSNLLQNYAIDSPEFLCVPECFRSVVYGAVRFLPDERAYQTAEEMAAAVRAAVRGLPEDPREQEFVAWLYRCRDESPVEAALRPALPNCETMVPVEEDPVAYGHTRWFDGDVPSVPAAELVPAAVPVVSARRPAWVVAGQVVAGAALVFAALVGTNAAWERYGDEDPGADPVRAEVPFEEPDSRETSVGPEQDAGSDPVVLPEATVKPPVQATAPRVAEAVPQAVVAGPDVPVPVEETPPEENPPEEPLPPRVTGGKWTLEPSEGVTSAWLVDERSGARHGQGQVPAGDYQIRAQFDGTAQPVSAGRLSVSEGQVARIACTAAFSSCTQK